MPLGKPVYPVIPLRIPPVLQKVENGKVPTKLLKKVKCGGLMYLDAANAFNKLYDAALKVGITLKNMGDYRTFERQEAMFNDRYSVKDEGRVPKVTRYYNRKIWFLKKGKSPSGVPGTSNHGLGLAIDLGEESNGRVVNLSARSLKWLCKNAPKYGFYMQVSDPKSPEFEAWHWQYCVGGPLEDGK